MSEITRVGVDLAKHVIQIHAVDAAGQRITSRALSRDKFMPWCTQMAVTNWLAWPGWRCKGPGGSGRSSTRIWPGAMNGSGWARGRIGRGI